MAPRITLLSDFGTVDGYVAAMKGAIAAIAPSATIDDATHDIPPGDVLAGAFALRRYWAIYPEGTVHASVVDPGVGSSRKAIVVIADGRILVAPDNGLLTFVVRDAKQWAAYSAEQTRFFRDTVSSTFHGRDVFAPLAAHLANGRKASEVGPRLEQPVLLQVAGPNQDGDRVRGEIVCVDHFGNLVTNIPKELVSPNARIRLGAHHIVRFGGTYADTASGVPLGLINSDDLLEVAVRDGSAARTFGIGRGGKVEVVMEQ